MKIPTIEECRKLGYRVMLLNLRNDYRYKEDGTWHIIQNGEETATMKIPTIGECRKLGYRVMLLNLHNDYCYKENDTWHIIQNGEETATGDWVWTSHDGDYGYTQGKTSFNFSHRLNRWSVDTII